MSNCANISDKLTDSRRTEYKDKAIRADVINSDWSNTQLTRLVAINKLFKGVRFSNATFDACYLRNSRFDSCDFTGVSFSSTNLHGAKFTGCVFNYATFERTIIDDAVLTDNCPAHENQKMAFARSLRMNYQQIGDAAAANHAIRVELDATEIHLRKAWKSNDHYYRKKYSGFLRAMQFFAWIKFKVMHYVWGNGESIFALLRAAVVFVATIAVLDSTLNPVPITPTAFVASLWRAPQIFFGVVSPSYISPSWLTIIVIVRLIAFGLFMSIVIKRFNRR